jgi:calcineurin B family protein 1
MWFAYTEFNKQMLREIQEETGFTSGQIDRLHSRSWSSPIPRREDRFRKLDVGNNGFLQRQDLLRIQELAINPLGDRIVHAFFFGKEDKIEFKVPAASISWLS